MLERPSAQGTAAAWAAGSVSEAPLQQRCPWLVQFMYLFVYWRDLIFQKARWLF